MLPNTSYLKARLPKALLTGLEGLTRIWDRGVGIHLGVFRLVSWKGSLCVCPSALSNIYQSVQTKYAPELLGGDTAPWGTEAGEKLREIWGDQEKVESRAKRVQCCSLPHTA